jgi:DNA-binding SARP family transcriptional activator
VFRNLLVKIRESPEVHEELQLHVRCMLSWAIRGHGHFAESVESYNSVVHDRERLLGLDHPDTLDARHSLAAVYLAQGDRARARAEFTHVLAARRRALGAKHPDTLETRKHAALASAQVGRWSTSRRRRQLQRVLTAQNNRLGTAHPSAADTRKRLALMRRTPRT